MALSGDLKGFELNDIFQFIEMGGKDGALHLKSIKGEGIIFFENGKILHAEVNDHTGTDAINELLNWKDGKFNFIVDEKTDNVTIDLPVQNVILEAARQIDEWKKMEDIIPSTDVIVDFVEEPEVGDIELQPVEWKTLSFINGKRRIKEIADKLDMKAFDVAKILYGLIQSGLVKVLK